jgi:hypothetical protein
VTLEERQYRRRNALRHAFSHNDSQVINCHLAVYWLRTCKPLQLFVAADTGWLLKQRSRKVSTPSSQVI